MLECMAKFTELARFVDDYVATNMAKVRKFEDGLKLSIWGKIVGLLLQDMDSMVRKTMAIEREVDDARSIRDADECRTHLCFEFISHAILCILYPYSCKTHKISSKLGFVGLLMKSK